MPSKPNQPFVFDESGMKRAVRAIQAYERSSGGKGQDILKPVESSGDAGKWFRITSSSQDGTNKRWVYSMTEVYKSGVGYNHWTDVSGGIATTKGYNGIEDQNGATGTYGVNIASTNLSGTFALKPLYTGARVRAWPLVNSDGDTEWWFTASNTVDGACP